MYSIVFGRPNSDSNWTNWATNREGRYNMTIFKSMDAGASWSVLASVYPHAASYSSLTLLDKGKGVAGLIYEAGKCATFIPHASCGLSIEFVAFSTD